MVTHQKGFTIVEIVIGIAILVILGGIVLYVSQNKSSADVVSNAQSYKPIKAYAGKGSFGFPSWWKKYNVKCDNPANFQITAHINDFATLSSGQSSSITHQIITPTVNEWFRTHSVVVKNKIFPQGEPASTANDLKYYSVHGGNYIPLGSAVKPTYSIFGGKALSPGSNDVWQLAESYEIIQSKSTDKVTVQDCNFSIKGYGSGPIVTNIVVNSGGPITISKSLDYIDR